MIFEGYGTKKMKTALDAKRGRIERAEACRRTLTFARERDKERKPHVMHNNRLNKQGARAR